MRRTVAAIVPALMLAVLAASPPAGAETLDFARASEMVLGRHPGLKALSEDLAAAEEAVRQASAFENPEIELGTENFGRNEIEVVISQPIPLGGVRGAAVDMARREAEIARLSLESERLAMEAELVRRFVSVLSAYERIALLDSLIVVSEEGITAVSRLVEAGAAMQIDLVRAELDRDELVLERLDLERGLTREQTSLAELWGVGEFRFDGVTGSLVGMLDVPAIQVLTAAIDKHPAAMLPDAEKHLARAELREARAEKWPELTLSAGYLQNNEADEGAPLAGLSLSLPIFDRKGAAMAARNHRVAAAEHRGALDRLERSTALSTLYSELEGSRSRLVALSDDLLPKAARIHTELQGFYARGRTGILDVLEARGHLLEVRMRILDLVEEQALLGADLMDLTGYEMKIIR